MRNGKSYSEAGKLGAIASLNSIKEKKKQRIEKYSKNPTKCKYCGKDFDYEHRHNKFCNKSCAASFNNHIFHVKTNNVSSENKKKEKEERFCPCGNKLMSNRKNFCSIKCQKFFVWQEKRQKIEETGFFEKSFGGEANRRIVKKYLIEKHGHKCQICGNTEWMGQPIPLIVDHIDGNSENSSVDNFRLICGNCNMQTNTFAGKNRHHGRFWRRQRYKEGKSC